MNKTIWFDFTNVPHVSFLLPFINLLEKDFKTLFSVRDFAETIGLFEKKIGKQYLLAGKHKGNNKLSKIFGVVERAYFLNKKLPYFDLKISVGGDSSGLVAKFRRKKAITFDDNETAPNWRYSWLSDFAFWPKCVDLNKLLKQGFKPRKLYQYDGFKEDIYLADYVPDPSFLKELPFTKYVVVRAENIKANYVNTDQSSIVPELLRKLDENKINVLFLPRYDHDVLYAQGLKNVFIPKEAVNGLDACYYSDAVITGAGTMAREAGCLGIPAISFYSGKNLLTVDKKMIEMGWLFYSRNVNDICNFLLKSKKENRTLDRCKRVQTEVKTVLISVMNKMGL